MKLLTTLFKYLFVLGIVGSLLGGASLYGLYLYLEPQLPSIENLKDVRYQVPLRVYTADNQLIAEFGEKRRIPVAYEHTPETMIQAFLAAEDDRFFSHPGVDYKGILRAGVQLALTGKRRQGGSTITMQVARNFYLSPEKTFTRKLNEIFLALKIETKLSKQQILALYLNKIYLGNRAYGIGAAAQIYYGKTIDELTLAETAMVAGLPKAPSRYNPIANPERATQRRNYILKRMLTLKLIDQSAYDAAAEQPVTAEIHRAKILASAPYIAEMARDYMIEHYGQDAYINGYNVYTTIDSQLQTAADNALRAALDAYDRRHGWRGPEDKVVLDDPINTEQLDQLLATRSSVAQLIPAIITEVKEKQIVVYDKQQQFHEIAWDDLKWARKFISEDKRGPKLKTAADAFSVGDIIKISSYQTEKEETQWRLAQTPKVTGALISLSPQDGRIIALTGGYDYFDSKFNRAIQAERQPGSGFKAFIYSAALEAGYTAASVINDAPVVFNDKSLEGTWRPENYSGKFFGPTRLRYALTKSRNLISIRLVRDIGVKYALSHAEKFGFDAEKLPHNLSLALGSASVTPLQMSRGYAVLANGGYLIDPYFVQRIEENGENIIYTANPATVCEDCTASVEPEKAPAEETLTDVEQIENKVKPIAPRVISKENRYIMYSMMQDVIQRGTGIKAKSLGRKDLAGKTGTTNDQRDAWFNGYNQSIVTNAWVGFDDNSKLGRGEVGGKAALPAWIDYMRIATKGTADKSPQMPVNMITARIDPKTGLRAPASMKNAVFETFRADHIPELLPHSVVASEQSPNNSPIESGDDKTVVEELF